MHLAPETRCSAVWEQFNGFQLFNSNIYTQLNTHTHEPGLRPGGHGIVLAHLSSRRHGLFERGLRPRQSLERWCRVALAFVLGRIVEVVELQKRDERKARGRRDLPAARKDALLTLRRGLGATSIATRRGRIASVVNRYIAQYTG